jgi:hypothetical protein
MLYRNSNGNTTTLIPIITGKVLAYGGRTRTAVESAFLGAKLHLDRIAVGTPTIGQSACLAGCSAQYVTAALAIIDDQTAVDAVLAGRVSLLEAQKAESLAAHYNRASNEERRAMAMAVGAGQLWDQLILPLLD